MIAVQCRYHGFRLLAPEQFTKQKVEEGHWLCPVCHAEAKSVDIPDPLLEEPICLFCKRKVNPWKGRVEYSEDRAGFFCDIFCERIYEQKLKEQAQPRKTT